MAKKSDSIDFEKSLKELEDLVTTMESGDLSLEDSLKHFERGITLTKACQQALKSAEQKVSILMQKAGEHQLEPFEPDEQED